MRVLVLWANPKATNLGVQALAGGTEALARRAWGSDTRVEFQDFASGTDKHTQFGGRSVLRDIGTRRPITERLQHFDVVVDTGGGDSFTDIYGMRRISTIHYVHRVCHRLGLPLILGPQTVGPFSHPVVRRLAQHSVRIAHTVIARDSTSLVAAEELQSTRVALATDVVFALPQPVSLAQKRDVIINVSGLLWNNNPHVDSAKYRRMTVELIDSLLATGRGVSLLAHVLSNDSKDNDVPAVEELGARYRDRVEVVIPESLDGVRSILASANIVVGARMHASLNALSVGTPAIPWAYSRKFSPLMNDLGWATVQDLRSDDFVVPHTVEFVEGASELKSDVASVLARTNVRLDAAEQAFREAISPDM